MRLELHVCYHERVRVFGDSKHDLKSLVIATTQLNSITAQLCVSCKTHLGTGKQVCWQPLNAGPLVNVWMQQPPQNMSDCSMLRIIRHLVPEFCQ